MAPNHPYVVRGTSKNGSVTYLCPTPEWAVRKHRDLMTSGLSDVTITGPEGQVLSLIDLEGASVEGNVPKACVLANQS